MEALMNRPYARAITIHGGKRGERTVKAIPIWGPESDPVPVSVWVVVNSDSGEKVINRIDGPFEGIEQAEQLALESAAFWYEKDNS